MPRQRPFWTSPRGLSLLRRKHLPGRKPRPRRLVRSLLLERLEDRTLL
jgi:hypothetical protein